MSRIRYDLRAAIRDTTGMEPRPHRWCRVTGCWWEECHFCGAPKKRSNVDGECPINTRLHHYLGRK